MNILAPYVARHNIVSVMYIVYIVLIVSLVGRHEGLLVLPVLIVSLSPEFLGI